MSKVIPFPAFPSAFLAPHGDRTCVWAQSPSGHFMLLAGSWMFAETARLFVTNRGYKLIDSDQGLLLVEQQMHGRMFPDDADRVH